MKVVIVDNYDSFTYNLYQLLAESGADVSVMRNDAFRLEDLSVFDGIVFSPGPGVPAEAGLMNAVIRHYAGKKPILGICLGEQAIAEVFGASLINLDRVYHGIQSPVRIVRPDSLFDGLPDVIPVGRYHSWVVSDTDFPDCLEVTARSAEGFIMALRHKVYDVRGVQFHPESVLTPSGRQMVANWLETLGASR